MTNTVLLSTLEQQIRNKSKNTLKIKHWYNLVTILNIIRMC